MELSAPRPIFCVHKGSIVQWFSIEPCDLEQRDIEQNYEILGTHPLNTIRRGLP